MLRITHSALWALALTLIFVISGRVDAQPAAASYAPGQLVVRYRTPQKAAARAASLKSLDAKFGLRKNRPLAARGDARRPALRNPARSTAAIIDSMEVLELDPSVDLQQALAAYKADPNVAVVEPNYLYSLCLTPTDPLFSNQIPDYDAVGLRTAWDNQIGSASVLVAVIDSGCDVLHEDLAGTLSPLGYDFVDDTNTLIDDQGHGTRVCALIGAAANNAKGIAGAAFGVTLLPLDVVASDGSILNSNVIEAIEYAVDHGAAVINMSFASSAFSQPLSDMIAAASQSAVIVAAVGNEGRNDLRRYPAAYDNVIGVAAGDEASTVRADFSNYNGPTVTMADLAAPGVSIFAGFPGSQYDGIFGSGTSYAAPFVAATAALLKSKDPAQSSAGVSEHLFFTANPAVTYTGRGFLKADTALATAMLPELSVASVTIDDNPSYSLANNNDGALDKGETVKLIVNLKNARSDGKTVTATLTTSDPLVSVGDGIGAWGDIASGTGKTSTDSFDNFQLSNLSTAHAIVCNLAVSANSGVYAANLQVLMDANNVQIIADGTNFFTPQIWTPDNTYVVEGQLNVFSDFTIQPGTNVRVKPPGNIDILGGNFSAMGTALSPIRFRAYNDLDDPNSTPGDLVWAKRAGGVDNYAQGLDIAALTDGSALVTGFFAGSAVFGPGEPGETTLTSAGSDDIFVAKYNPDGTLAWARRAGGTSDDHGGAIAVLSDGTALTTGFFVGSAVFGPGEPGETTLAEWGVFLAKYNPDGTLAWAKNANGGSGIGIAALADGSALVTGAFYLSVVFGPGEPGETTLTSPSGSNDIFVAKYNPDGTLAWAKAAGEGTAAAGIDISVLIDGSVLTTGYFAGSAVFGSGEPGETNLTSGDLFDLDIFVAKYNPDGTLAWAKSAGGLSDFEGGTSIAALADGSALITGDLGDDIFVAKYDSDGTLVWSQQVGGGGHCGGSGIAVLADGSAWVTGFFAGSAVFGPGEPGETTLTSAGSDDIFVAKYNPDGTLVWARRAGGTSDDQGRAIAVLSDGTALTTGVIYGSAVFGPGEPGATTLTPVGNLDIFVARFMDLLPWKKLIIRNTVVSASISQFILSGGGLLNELAATNVSDCIFTHSSYVGFQTTAGTGAVSNCSANFNYLDGMVLGDRHGIDCSAEGNGGTGIMTTGLLTRCAATANRSNGLMGNGADTCMSQSNSGSGIVSSGAVINSIVQSNGGLGIVCTAGNVTGSTAQLNGAFGISITGGGIVSGSTASLNSGGGISTDGSAVQDCIVENNTGIGIAGTGSSTVDGCRVAGTIPGPALSGVQTVTNSAISSNGGGGISGATTVDGAYIAGNSGNGITGGAISTSSIVYNNDPSNPGTIIGVSDPVSVTNSWIVGNNGIGIRSNNAGTVTSSSIQGNLGGGVQNLAPLNGLNSSNLFGNSIFEAKDTQPRTGPGPYVKNFQGTYWGPTLTTWMGLFPYPNDRDPEIVDGFDGAVGWFIDYSLNAASLLLNAPDTTPPAFLFSVSPDQTNPVNVQVQTFTLTFSEDMNTAIDPTVTFNLSSPFTKNVLTPSGITGWIDPKTWQGTFAIEVTTGDGLQTIRVSGATAADGFVIPDDTYHQFVIDTSGATVANNGIATAGANDAFIGFNDGGAGSVRFNILRTSTPDPTNPLIGRPGTYQQVGTENSVGGTGTLIFHDTGLVSGTKYYWIVYRETNSGDDEPWTGPVSDLTDGPSPTPSPSPTLSATPSPSASPTPSVSPTVSPTPSASPLISPTESLTPTDSATPTASPSPSQTPAPGQLQFQPASLDLGTQDIALGQSVAQNIIIKNTGSGTLTISSVALAGVDALDFGIFNDSNQPNLSPGSIRMVAIFLDPTTTGLKNAVLRVNSSDPSQPTADLPLTGTGTSGVITVSPGSISFGSQDINTTPVSTTTVTITNGRLIGLGIASVTLEGTNPGDFVKVLDSGQGTLSATQSRSIQIAFDTNLPLGPKTATLRIVSTDPTRPTIDVPLTGEAVSLSPNAARSWEIYE